MQNLVFAEKQTQHRRNSDQYRGRNSHGGKTGRGKTPRLSLRRAGLEAVIDIHIMRDPFKGQGILLNIHKFIIQDWIRKR